MPKRKSEQLADFFKKNKIDHEIFNFTDKIADYYMRANLVLTRSGASVLGELINLKILLFPIPLFPQQIIINIKTLSFIKKKVMDI